MSVCVGAWADNKFDINRDGKVNSTDIVAVYNCIENTALSYNADTNGDGKINSTDIVAIYNFIAGKIGIRSITKNYSINVSTDMLKVANIEVAYIDANNNVVTEPLTTNKWEKSELVQRRPAKSNGFPASVADISNTDLGMSMNYSLTNFDTKQNYNIAFEQNVFYTIVYEDGSVNNLPAYNINPQCHEAEGQYMDNTMNAFCQTATNARDYDEGSNRPEMSDYWNNVQEGYAPREDMGGGQQYNPSIIISNNYVNYEWVDLGLSVYWATRNVGASTPYEAGGLYGWGDATGYHTETNNRFYPMSRPDITNISGTREDIAHVQWGPDWRMPTNKEAIELIDNCTMKRETIDGCEGVWFISKINNNKIFLPAAGDRYAEIIRNTLPGHACGYYWTSDLYPTDNAGAYSFRFDSYTNVYKPVFKDRYFGCSVRPVKDK